jgi:ComF family protein
MHDFFTHLIDLVFPPRTEECLVRELSLQDVSAFYTPTRIGPITALSNFQNSTLRALIHEAKFESNRHAQKLLASLITEHIKKNPQLHDALWVPIPLSPARLRARGYNQVLEILSHAECQYAPGILKRVRDTLPQTTLAKAERLKNVHGAFTCADPQRIEGQHIVILDDVTTTGATLMTAYETLLPYHPRQVTRVAIAH